MPEKAFLPLFPLQIVLLPNERSPLRIFEPRYRKMIGGAIEHETEFGIVQSRDDNLEAVGCGARVDRVTERYDDGRFNIEIHGTRRFRTLSLDRSEDVLQGVIEYFEDDSPAQANLAQVEALIALAAKYGKLMQNEMSDPFEPNHPLLSFQVAGRLSMDLTVKQQLLKSRSEIERVELLSGYFQAVLEQFERRRRGEGLAAVNGHAKLG